MSINRRIAGGEIINEASVEGEVNIPKSYYNRIAINGHELVGDMSSSDDLDIEVLKNDLTASRTVGGVNSGASYSQGTMLEKILRDILNPLDFPVLTNPSMTIRSNIPTLQESGTVTSATLTIIFSRGSISPAYGTSGYRAGEATGYLIDSGTQQASNTFILTVSSTNATHTGRTYYSAGEQPLDSEGNPYNDPLSAGSVTSSIIFEFADVLWATIPEANTVSKQALLSRNVGTTTFTFPAQTVANPNKFDVPANWNVTSIEVFNEMSSKYEDCAREFSTSNVTHEDAGGNTVNYIRYTDNRGYASDSRKIKITWL